MKSNQHIEDYLNAYRKMAGCDFAVMITGPWGCGKTYFVKQYLERHCTSDGEKQYLYISLNGITSTAEIDMALFQAAHPLLGSKLAVTAGKVVRASLKAGLKLDIDIDRDGKSNGSIKMDPLVGLSLTECKLPSKGKMLVFDDLERCLMSPGEILGYINAFVESKEAKVLIVGDENHFGVGVDHNYEVGKESDAQDVNAQSAMSKYWVIKEKVVGKTFRLAESIEEIFDDLIIDKELPSTYGTITRNKESVIEMFKRVSEETENKKYNYRALKHCFRDFEYFFKTIDKCYSENAGFLDQLLQTFIALDYEVQLANISSDDFYSEGSSYTYLELGEDEKNLTRLQVILKRHDIHDFPLAREFSSNIFPMELWGMILGNEFVDIEQINEAIRNSIFFPKEQLEWVRLWHWRSLDDDEASTVLQKVRGKIDNHEYTVPEVIAHVFSIMYGLAEEGAIEEAESGVLEKADNYLDYLVGHNKLDKPVTDFGSHWTDTGSYGLGYWRNESEFFPKLVATIDTYVKQAVQANFRLSVGRWLELIRNHPVDFFESLVHSEEYRQYSILKYFEESAFVDAVSEIPNEQKWVVSKTLMKRYEHYGNDLTDELPFIRKVCEELQLRIESHEGCVTPTIANMKYLKEELSKIKKMLEAASG